MTQIKTTILIYIQCNQVFINKTLQLLVIHYENSNSSGSLWKNPGCKNIKRLLDEENDGFSEDFKREFVECFDDIMENPNKYHMFAGRSIRNTVRMVSVGALRKSAGNSRWLDDNWLKIAKELYPHIKKELA